MRIVLTLTLLATLTGCGGRESGAAHRPRVAAAFYPLAFAAEQIGGAHVDVWNLTSPGAEPHDAELSARTVERVRASELVVYLGDFQPALEQALEGARGRSLDALQGLTLLGRDPHVWLDPLRYATIVRRLGKALEQPRRAAALERKLHALDRAFRRGLHRCERRAIVTSHAAFGYLAERYRLEQISLGGLAPEGEPTPRELERVVSAVRDERGTTIYVEPLLSRRLARTVARETGARVAVLSPLEGLTEKELKRGEDYFSVMRRNLESLRKGLGCR